MSASRIRKVRICYGGRIYKFNYLDKTWHIEMHHWCGPCWLNSDLEPRKNSQPGPASQFWKAVAHLEAMTPAEKQRCEV